MIVPAQSPVITCQCIRVPVLNGHTAAVFVKFKKKPTKEELIDRLVHFSGEPQRLELPSAPKQFIQYLEDDNRPQVTLDVDYENGMAVGERIRFTTGSLLAYPTIRSAEQRAAQCFVQSCSKHRDISQRNKRETYSRKRREVEATSLSLLCRTEVYGKKVIYRRETECGPGVCKSAEISDEPQGWLSGIGRGDCDLVRWSSGYDELSGSVRYQV